MAIYPAVAVRTSIPLALNRMLFQVHGDEAAIFDLQMQLSTGRRLLSASQDLPATIKILAAQRQLEFRAQTDRNLNSAEDVLSASETSLAQISSILNEMRGVAVEGSSNIVSDEQRQALAQQIDAAIARLVELGNSKYADQYLFAGSRVRSNPLKQDQNAVQFLANYDNLNTIADYATTLAANVTADDVFGVQSEKVVGTTDLNPNPELDTPLSHLNRGKGVRLGGIRLSNGLQNVEIDLTGAHTIGDVVERLAPISIGGRELNVSLTGSHLTINYADGLGGLLRIEELSNGNAASDLGINNTGTPQNSPVVGGDLNPVVTLTTRLSSLFGGSGIPAGASFQISQGDDSYIIETDGLATVEDLLNRMEQSGARMQASIDSSGRFLQIQSTESGTAFSIGENGGSLATLLGLRSMSASTPVSSLNFGQGIGINDNGSDLIFTRTDGTTFEVDLSGVQTVGDVINRINNHPNNLTGPLRVIASLATVGNGLQISSTTGTQPISVTNSGGSSAATGLGWTTGGQTTAVGTSQGTSNVITGIDNSQSRVDGLFTSLILLRRAIETGAVEDMPTITESLDRDLARLSIARGTVGVRHQTIASRLDKSAEDQVNLKATESEYLDADLASVISELTARQTALQASLQMIGQTARMTLFDYL